MSEIESGDSSRCDVHLRDLVTPGGPDGGYGKVSGSERVIFPWAKVETEHPGVRKYHL